MRAKVWLDEILRELAIEAASREHLPVATVEEADAIWHDMGVRPVKNLFLKDDKSAFWLVVVPGEMRVDLKALPAVIGSRRLRFASAEDLARLLGVAPGGVSPLALINDPERVVEVAIAAALDGEQPLGLHPLRNDATISMKFGDLIRFLARLGRDNVVKVI